MTATDAQFPLSAARSGLAGLVDRLLQAARHGVRGVALRAGTLGGAAVAASWLHSAYDPGVLCLLRRVTGIPCPGCGATTVFIELGAGHLESALLANPVVITGAVGLVLAPLGLGRRWWALPTAVRTGVIAGAIAASWLWQLHRFGLLWA